MPGVGKTYHVYILASDRNGTLYIGVTGSLAGRMSQHRNGTADSFTKRYGVTKLVHAEEFTDINMAIPREKAPKEVAPGMETGIDRARQSGLARPVRRSGLNGNRTGFPRSRE